MPQYDLNNSTEKELIQNACSEILTVFNEKEIIEQPKGKIIRIYDHSHHLVIWLNGSPERIVVVKTSLVEFINRSEYGFVFGNGSNLEAEFAPSQHGWAAAMKFAGELK